MRITLWKRPGVLKAGTHQPNRWTCEAFGETGTRSGTNMFGVFSCIRGFRSCLDAVCSIQHAKSEEVAVGHLSHWILWLCASWMAVLIGGVQANQRNVWEERNTECAVFFYALCSVILRFHVLQYRHETSCHVRSEQFNCMFSMQLFLSEIVKFRFDRK